MEQAKELCSAVKSKCKLYLPDEMDHNAFDFMEDFIYPLIAFYEEFGLSTNLKWIKPKKKLATEALTGTESSVGSTGDSGIDEEKPQIEVFYVPIKAFNKPV